MTPIANLRKQAMDAGFVFEKSAKHTCFFRHPTGVLWSHPHTPSKPSSITSTRADLKRAIREVQKAERAMSTFTTEEVIAIKENNPGIEPTPHLSWTLPPEFPRKECQICGIPKLEAEFAIAQGGPKKGQHRSVCMMCAPGYDKRTAEYRARKKAPIQARHKNLARHKPPVEPEIKLEVKEVAKNIPKNITTTDVDPEALAVKVLIHKHRDEYDQLVETFMLGLWS